MRISFIGTGTITSAVVSGLNALDSTTFTFLLSPRNAGVGAALASAFDNITVAASNQAVLDGCDVVMLAVRPQVAVDVIELLHFRPDHHVISLIALISLERVQALVAPATRVVRAIPLPMVATRAGMTALYPDDSTARAIFTQLGSTIVLESSEHFNAFSAATATMAPYFAFAGEVTEWLTRRGVPSATARSYIAGVFHGLATVAANPSAQPFPALAEKFGSVSVSPWPLWTGLLPRGHEDRHGDTNEGAEERREWAGHAQMITPRLVGHNACQRGRFGKLRHYREVRDWRWNQ